MILKPTTSPFGAAIGYHCVKRIEGNLDDAHAQLSLTVHSWPAEEDYVAHQGRGPTHVWYLTIDQAAIDGAQLLASIEQALVSASPEASPFAGGSIVAPVTGLAAARVRQWARIKQTRDVLNKQPIEHDGIEVDGDDRSRQNLMGAIMAMQLTGETSRQWVCADNVKRLLTLEQIIALGTALAARTQDLVETGDALRAQIFDPALETVEAVEAVAWPVAAP